MLRRLVLVVLFSCMPLASPASPEGAHSAGNTPTAANALLPPSLDAIAPLPSGARSCFAFTMAVVPGDHVRRAMAQNTDPPTWTLPDGFNLVAGGGYIQGFAPAAVGIACSGG